MNRCGCWLELKQRQVWEYPVRLCLLLSLSLSQTHTVTVSLERKDSTGVDVKSFFVSLRCVAFVRFRVLPTMWISVGPFGCLLLVLSGLVVLFRENIGCGGRSSRRKLREKQKQRLRMFACVCSFWCSLGETPWKRLFFHRKSVHANQRTNKNHRRHHQSTTPPEEMLGNRNLSSSRFFRALTSNKNLTELDTVTANNRKYNGIAGNSKENDTKAVRSFPQTPIQQIGGWTGGQTNEWTTKTDGNNDMNNDSNRNFVIASVTDNDIRTGLTGGGGGRRNLIPTLVSTTTAAATVTPAVTATVTWRIGMNKPFSSHMLHGHKRLNNAGPPHATSPSK